MANLVIKNNIKKAIKELDKENQVGNIAGDFTLEFQKKVEQLLQDAINRAKANNRRTLYARDL